MHVSKAVTHTHTQTCRDHHSLVSHNSTRHHGILHINWCCLVAIFTPPQPLRQTHYPLISRTWLFIKLGRVQQSHGGVSFQRRRNGKFAECVVAACLELVRFVNFCENTGESAPSSPLLFLSPRAPFFLPLLHVRSSQRAGARTQHSHQKTTAIRSKKQMKKSPTSKALNGAKVRQKPAENSLQQHSGQQLRRHIAACYHAVAGPGWLTAALGVGCSQRRITAFIEFDCNTVFNFTGG